MSHPLDRPIWEALGAHHAAFAETTPLARRYRPEFGPLAAVVAETDAAFAALRGLIRPGGGVGVLAAGPLAAPPGCAVLQTFPLLQFITPVLPPPPDPAPAIAILGPADAAEMAALAALTEPGPFAARTGELGRYLGIRVEGRLVALAGERMRLDGFTEISAVCTHPDWRGRGYARALVLAVGQAILARGDVAFLHVMAGNQPAIGLYRELGFTERGAFCMTVLRRSEA